MTMYAASTDVSCDRSRAEIDRIVTKYGATQFMYGWQDQRAVVQFVCNGRHIRFELPLPKRDDPKFSRTPTGRIKKNQGSREAAWEQSCRQRWRALSLVIKAKLEAVQSGITTFDDEFLAHIVLANNQTVGQCILPRLDTAISGNVIAGLLPPPQK
ncbi:hypothetical protein [Trichococcus shcherbakoviae]|uniref:hypothetical protein n=1 Tax=Trichococcus shcherbakoviae TaxID=2094020 RepID=UPI002AA6137F|nr:hypothetical protein [Trichococcus shcherbakoviae]